MAKLSLLVCLCSLILLGLVASIPSDTQVHAASARILDREFELQQLRQQQQQQQQQQQLKENEQDQVTLSGDESASPGSPSPSPSDEASSVAPTPQGNTNPNSNSNAAMQNLAGMGITVVLRNRNHIRTIQDKSAARAGREEAKKQSAMEQRRKEARRNQDRVEADKRRQLEQLEEKEDSDKQEAERKTRTEQTVKATAKEADERQEKLREQTKKAEEKREAETRKREQQEEEADKTRAKERQRQEEEKNKRDENEQKGSIQVNSFKPAQGRVLRDASRVPNGLYTYMFWIRPLEAQGPWSNIMHKGQADANRNPAVWFYPGQTRLHIRSASSASWGAGGNNGCDPGNQLVVGEWTHVAFSHSSAGLTVYYNGNVVCTSNYGGPVSNSGPLYASNPWYTAAKCDLADFRMVARVVDAEEVQKAYSEKRGLN